jgi:hypothetical protein
MNATPEVAVTLSPELFEHLRAEAKRLRVPLSYLVAGLVLDTVEAPAERPEMALAG